MNGQSIPQEWYNIVALLEDGGIRYYCNVASPPYSSKQIITYIDYDLERIQKENTPFDDESIVYAYYELWKNLNK